MMIRFPAWLPDQPSLDSPGLVDAKNVYPATMASYGPWNALQEVGTALTARCQGAGWFRGVAGTIVGVAGDATKLYTWTGAAWNDASRTSGGAYATSAENGWSFAQFGDYIVGCNGTDAPQKYQIGSSTDFEALGGSPSVARFVVPLRDFLLFGRVPTAQNRVFWSAINNIESYVAGTNQSDEQDIPDGGRVMGLAGGEYGVVWTERSIHRLTYQGPPIVFRRDRITDRIGCCAENSIATYEQTSFFLDFDGFYSIAGGQSIQRISNQILDDYFWNNVNPAYLHRVCGVIDPSRTLYIVAWPSSASTDGTTDRLLIYNFGLGEPRWSRVEQDVDWLVPFYSNQGYHTDNIDLVIGDTDATTLLVDTSQFQGSGQASLAAFSTAFKLATFEGAALEALIETQEVQIAPGQRTHLREVWPFFDGGTIEVSIGYRNLPGETVTYTGYVAQNSVGFVPINLDARFMRGRFKVPAGSTWSHGQGADLVARKAGRY